MAYVINDTRTKLYDPRRSRYVTPRDRGDDPGGPRDRRGRRRLGEDLTSVTGWPRFILENERNHRAALPTAFLHQLIKHGEAWQDFVQRSMKSSLEASSSASGSRAHLPGLGLRAGWGWP